MARVHCDVISLLYGVLCFPRVSIVIAPGNRLWHHESIVQLPRINPWNAAKTPDFWNFEEILTCGIIDFHLFLHMACSNYIPRAWLRQKPRPKGSVSDFVMTSGSNLNTPQKGVMKTYNRANIIQQCHIKKSAHRSRVFIETFNSVSNITNISIC